MGGGAPGGSEVRSAVAGCCAPAVATKNAHARTRFIGGSLVERAADDHPDGDEDRAKEDRYGDIALLELVVEIDLRRQDVDHAIRDVHEDHAEDGVDEVHRDDGQLHQVSLEFRLFPVRTYVTRRADDTAGLLRSEEHTSELQSRQYLVCR